MFYNSYVMAYLGETSAQSLARLTQTKVIATYTPSKQTIRGTVSTPVSTSKTISVFLKPTTPEQIKTAPIEAPFYQKLREAKTLTPVELLVGGYKAGVYYPSILGSAVYTQKGMGITPEGKTVELTPEGKIVPMGSLREPWYKGVYTWLRTPVETGIQEWLTKDVTLRDISKSVIGEAPPKTPLEEWGGIIKWGVVGLVAIAVISFFKK